jgi:hypothetical protein
MYPTITSKNADFVAEKLREEQAKTPFPSDFYSREFLALEEKVHMSRGADIAETDLYETATLMAEWIMGGRHPDKYAVEEYYAEYLHEYLSTLPVTALQDPGFWRYLALFPFRSYLVRREPDLKETRYGGGSGSKKTHWLIPRSFLWGRKTHEEGDEPYARTHQMRAERLAAGLTDGTIIDFYHSHIVRTAWSANSLISRAFIDAVFDGEKHFDVDNSASRPTNQMASAVARLSNNIFLEVAPEAVTAEVAKVKARLVKVS